jgi:hypothetical protein
MTYLPGTDEAIYPGTNHITADVHLEDDRHTVILDASAIATPTLDGFVATFGRALDDVGLLDEFCTLARNRANVDRCMQALGAIHSERSVARTLMFTLTPADADRIGTDCKDAALERPRCARCSNYAVDREHCLVHVDPEDGDDVAWAVAG